MDTLDPYTFGEQLGVELNDVTAMYLETVKALIDRLDDVPMPDLERGTTKLECTRMVAQYLRDMGDAFDRQIDGDLYGEPPDVELP